MSLKDLALELFCQFDEDNKGYITQDQLLNGSSKDGLFAEFSEIQILSIFELLDKENKGVITLSDFTDAFVTDTSATSTNGNADTAGDDYYHQNEMEQHQNFSNSRRGSTNNYSPLLLDGEEIYARSPSPRVYGSMDSLSRYCEDDDEDELMIRKPRSASCQSDDDWWRSGSRNSKGVEEILDHDLPSSPSPPPFCMKKRTDSLPSIMDPLILKKTLMMTKNKRKSLLLNSKKWVSVDQGIDRSSNSLYHPLPTNGLLEQNNNLKNKKLSGMTQSDSRIDKILVPLKKLSKHLSNSRNELRDLLLGPVLSVGGNALSNSRHNSNDDIELTSTTTSTTTSLSKKRRPRRHHGNTTSTFFGSKDSVLSSIRCNSCASLRSMDNNKYFSSSEDLSISCSQLSAGSGRGPRRNYGSLLKVFKKPPYAKHPSHEHTCSDLDYSDTESGIGGRRHLSRDSLLSNQNGGFYISCENVSSPIVADVSIENWETFLKKIGGVSLFAG